VSDQTKQAAKTLYSKNLRAFARHHPEVLRKLPVESGETGHVIYKNGRAENIRLLDVELYPEPAPEWSVKQVATYLADPDRLKAPDPLDDSQPPLTYKLAEDLQSFANDLGVEELESYPVDNVGFTFVFGVGLGYHIPLLIERCPAEQMVIVEPVPEFLKHSLYVLDWGALFEQAAEKGIALSFKIGLAPERFILEVEALVIHSRAERFIDGTHAFVHYPSWQVIECRKLLNERIKNFLIRPSHFGDEKIMMRNVVDNLADRSFHLIEGNDEPSQDTPVMIVGSGPSVDADLKNIARLREGAILVSCGSSLGILLKNGIEPDFHLENENTYPLVRNLKSFQEKYGFGSISLIASATVNREVAEMFKRSWFYFRSTLSPAEIFAPAHSPVTYAGPLVANAALAALSSLGFRKFVLFGIDCGRAEGGLHHSKDAVYYEDGYDNFVEGEGHDYLEGEFTRLVPGNFGGKVATSAFYDLSRRTITELIRVKNLEVTNCSRGAQIEGAKPKVSGALNWSSLADELPNILKGTEEALSFFDPHEFLKEEDFDHHIEACNRVLGVLEVSIASDPPKNYIWLQRRLDTVFGVEAEAFLGVSKLVSGSLLSLARFGCYRGSRIDDAEKREAYFQFFLERFVDYARQTIKEAQSFLIDIKKAAF